MSLLCEVLKKINIDINNDSAKVISLKFYAKKDTLELILEDNVPLSFESYQKLFDGLKNSCHTNVDIIVRSLSNDNDIQKFHKYLNYFANKNELSVYKKAMPSLEKDEIKLCFYNDADKQLADNCLSVLTALFDKAGFHKIKIENITKEINAAINDVIVDKTESNKKVTPVVAKNTYRKPKMDDYQMISLSNIEGPMDFIKFKAKIFSLEEVVSKKGNIIQTMMVHDDEDAIIIKRYENKIMTKEILHEVSNGDSILVYGSIVYDNYAKDLVCNPRAIEKVEEVKIEDKEENKRIELHAHTTMSEMDGVTDVKDLVSFAFNLGHKGICICDHAGVQAFAKAHNQAKALSKGLDEPFKVLYGCEMNMVDEKLMIVKNGNDSMIDDVTYIAFDLETTGLSCYFDHIIEFGAVKIVNNTIVDRKQLFIKPPVSIPDFIQEKTNITDLMVKDALPFKDVIDDILSWIQDGVLVAHNATFDFGFLNEELKRIGRKPLTNVVIDTLDFARAIHSDRRAYRLGNIARLYRISYDEEVAHRADYDAEVLAEVFLCMIKDAKKLEAKTINDLQKLQSSKSFAKVRKSHVVVMAKNQHGIKDIYQLVTTSNTKTLAVFGKANGKSGEEFLSEPRIFRSEIIKHRENLLIGSACYNGEVFEHGANSNDEMLAKAISFYDYIEIQPLQNYLPLLNMHSVQDEQRLKDILRRIINEAKRQNKIIVATGDVHYLTPADKKFRDIYIATQGVGGVRHPLYIYNAQVRRKSKNPDQHFLTTRQMLDAFSWLDDPNLIYDMVVTNTNKVYDMVEYTQPVPSGTYPPIIEGSSDKLSAVCYETAHKIYGDPLPEIVSARLEKELHSIITNGYAVVYYISHLLVKKSNKDGYLVGSRGSVGSSFVATMSGITEVNPLKPHYVCPVCHYYEFIDDESVASGFDLPDKPCPKCKKVMRGNGQNIPFETFLGFNGDKVPDIDLNFSNEYQAKAHAFTKEVFGEDHVFRAGTIGTVANKTAYGYVSGYAEEMGIENMRKVTKDYLAAGCEGVKRTTGQHPGGIIVIPQDKEASDFTAVQYPANDENSEWKTTHFDFHDIHDNVLKFDLLGHVDPTAMRLLQNLSGIDPHDIPMNDKETMSLFSSCEALKADSKIYHEETGALGLPEFGTKITRRVLEETRPKTFGDLVIISGLTHGTDVWAGNAQVLVQNGVPINEVIGCRDDIMTYLISKGVEPIVAFTIMESVRKGKGLKPEWEKTMSEHNVYDWYIDSCKKIKYMFPKAHAVAYVIMAVRIAWYKVHLPHIFYVQFLSLRCDAYEIETMTKGVSAIVNRMNDIQERMSAYCENPATNKERSLYDTLEVCLEMYARGYSIANIDIYKSKATQFTFEKDNPKVIIPPFVTIDGLGANVAKSIEEAREKGEFLSKEDLIKRTQLSNTLVRKLEILGCLDGMQEENQMSLF